MPKYIPVADKIAEGLFAAKNRLFDFVQKSLDEGQEEKEIMKTIKETLTADPAVLSEIEYTFFKKKAKIVEDGYALEVEDLNAILDKLVVGQLASQKGILSIPDNSLITALVSDYGFTSNDAENVLEHYYLSYGGKGAVIEWNKPSKSAKFNPYRTTDKKASWINDAKVGDQVELNDEVGEVTYIGNDKIEVKTPTKTETIWKN